MDIDKSEFTEYLSPYVDEHIYLDRVQINQQDGEVCGIFHRGRYPYSKKPLEYLAGSEAVLFLTQLLYVLAGLGLKLQWPASNGKSVSVFLDRIARDKVHLTHLDIRFRKKVERKEEIPVRFRLKSTKKIGSSMHLLVDFDFDNSFLGTISAVMLL